MRKRLKNKRRSCGLCKPHKRGWADRRTMQETKRDIADERDGWTKQSANAKLDY